MATLTEFKTFVSALNTIQASGKVFNQIQKLSDGVHETSPTLAYLNANAAKRDFSGADVLTFDVIKDEHLAQSYYGGSKLNISVQEFMQTCMLPRAYYTNDVSYYRTQLIQNNSKDKFQSYVAKCLDQSKEGMATRMVLDLFGNGTTDVNGGVAGGTASVIRPLVGFEAAIETNPLAGNEYAGVTRGSSTSWFNNQYMSISNLSSLSTLDLKKMVKRCTHMGKSPDLIVLSDEGYEQVWSLAKAEQWLKDSKEAADLGFPENIKFGSATIISEKFLTGKSEGGYLTAGSAKRIYFLNTTDGFEYKIDPSEDMKLGAVLTPTDEHSFTQHITWSGQLAVINPRLNGVIYWA